MTLYQKLFLVFLVFPLTCGLGCMEGDSDSDASLSNTQHCIDDSNISETAKGLPDLYCNLKDTPLSAGINPVHLDGRNTLLPFPSDILAYRDTLSPTGVRLKITNENFPPQIEMLPECLQLKTLYKNPDGSDADGYSAATNVLFEFDREVDSSWVRNEDDFMARDGGDVFRLLDLTTGEFVPALAMESHYAKDKNMATRDYVMQVMARKRFEYGRRYMAFVTKDFKDRDGRDFACSTGFSKAKSGDGSEISNFYEPYLKYLETYKGIDRNKLLAATIFTIRSRESTIDPLISMFKTVLKDDFNDEHVRITSNVNVSDILPVFSRILYGRMLFRSFRDDQGVLRYTAGFTGQRNADDKKNWVPFLFFIPSETKTKPYPVNILGSGIGMTKELMILNAMYNARVGVASIVVDWPGHGERIVTEGWSVYEGIGWIPGSIQADGAGMPRLLSMFMQIPIDSMSIYRALKTYFANSDEKGLRDLDTDNLSYIGLSLGSLCGTSAAACMPDLRGAFLHVASANFSKVLSCGTFLEGVVSASMPEGLTGAWYAAGMCSIIGQQGDMFDGLHYADGFRIGVPEMNTGPRALAGTFAANDGWVTTEGGITLVEVAEMPVIDSQDTPVYMQDLIENVMGEKSNDTFVSYDNYGMIQLSITNPEWNLNQIMDQTYIWTLVQSLTHYDFYDVAGTLEHAIGAMCPTAGYYQMDWIEGVQCKD